MDLLTVQETARLLRVNPVTVRRFIAAGKLPAVRVGRGVRVERGSIERLVEAEAPATSEPPFVRLGRPMTFEDPIWQLVGMAKDAEPTDSSRKYDYLFPDE